MAIDAEPLVDRPDTRQVDTNAFRGFEIPDHHEPPREEAELFAVEGEELDVSYLEELQQRVLLGVEGLASPGGPRTGLENPNVVTQDPDRT